jgi:Flp pilus assembly protein TadG
MYPRFPHRRQGGGVAIMVALALLVLLAVVGLVIDGGLAYLVKARLNAAVDSAALAAARAVPAGNNQTEQRASAQAASAKFFAANIPSDYLLSTPTLLSTEVTFDAGTVTIDVNAEAPMPVSLMQVLGFTALTPRAYAQTIRRDLDMALVVDNSGSLSGNAVAVRAAAKSFLNKFNVTQDRVALIQFGAGAEVDNPINTLARGFDRNSMLGKIDRYNFPGSTSSVEGMWHARDQLNKIALINRSAMRVIVFFSDGAPTGFGAAPTFITPTDCRDGAGNPIPGVLNNTGAGLSRLDDSNAVSIGDPCAIVRKNVLSIKKLPEFYNAHDDKREFPIVTSAPRTVTADLTASNYAQNIDNAARNLPEAVAAKAREEGVFVFTLGMGSSLKARSGYYNETGESVLKCMANVADGPARCYDVKKPVGMYCYAATEADLTPCFSRLASAILRISK